MPVRLLKTPSISPTEVTYRASAGTLIRQAKAGQLNNADVQFVPPRLGTRSLGHWVVRVATPFTNTPNVQTRQTETAPAAAQASDPNE